MTTATPSFVDAEPCMAVAMNLNFQVLTEISEIFVQRTNGLHTTTFEQK